MRVHEHIHCVLLIISSFRVVFGTEFTFNLPDSSEECFHETVSENVSCTLEFQVRIRNYDSIYVMVNLLYMYIFKLHM